MSGAEMIQQQRSSGSYLSEEDFLILNALRTPVLKHYLYLMIFYTQALELSLSIYYSFLSQSQFKLRH